MKTRDKILAIAGGVIFLTVLGLGVCEMASAQETYPDIDLVRQGSTYGVGCQPVEPIDKLVQICVVRTDLENLIELGCVDHTDLSVATIVVTVDRTPHIDGQLRCYAVDSEGNLSLYSENIGIADFTPPGRPHVK